MSEINPCSLTDNSSLIRQIVWLAVNPRRDFWVLIGPAHACSDSALVVVGQGSIVELGRTKPFRVGGGGDNSSHSVSRKSDEARSRPLGQLRQAALIHKRTQMAAPSL